jgi:hypothetical protein
MTSTKITIWMLFGAFFMASIASYAFVWIQKPKGIYATVGLRTAIAEKWSTFLLGCALLVMVVGTDDILGRAGWAITAMLCFFGALRCQAKVYSLRNEGPVPGGVPPIEAPQAH